MTTIDRMRIAALEDIPNVGPSIAGDLRRLGIRAPRELAGRDPYALYEALNRTTGTRHDPCLLDTFIAAVRFMEGAPARPWWKYTAERKRTLARQAARALPPPPRQRKPPAGGAARTAQAPLRSIGPVSKRMLAAAGITSVETLRELGAVEAYRRVRSRDPRASLNLLWALEGVVSGRPWQEVARNDRLSLLLQLDEGSSRVTRSRTPPG
jgi:predicted flap endonuclease-1-like 5' DNA nuclease